MATEQRTIVKAKCDHCGKTAEAQPKELRTEGWMRTRLYETKIRTTNWNVVGIDSDLCPACHFQILEFFPDTE